MANFVSKDEVKNFIRDVRIELDARYAARFAPLATVANVKSELNSYVKKEPGKDLSSNDFTDEEKLTLARLAEGYNSSDAYNEAFNAADLLEIFED